MIATPSPLRVGRIVSQTAQRGQFDAAIVVDHEGLPVAAVSSRYDADTLAALLALVHGVVQRAESELRMGPVEEMSITSTNRARLVCRYFWAEGHRLILAVVAPPDRSYRRLTSRAIRQIKDAVRGRRSAA